jgi:hypothetical protein
MTRIGVRHMMLASTRKGMFGLPMMRLRNARLGGSIPGPAR